jgi:hypothetical protein
MLCGRAKLRGVHGIKSGLRGGVSTRKKTEALFVPDVADCTNYKAGMDCSSTRLLSSYCLEPVRRDL